MPGRRIVSAVGLALAVAGSCTNDFDQFDVNDAGNGASASGGTSTGARGGASGASSGTAGSTLLGGGSGGIAGSASGGGGTAGTGASAAGEPSGGMAGTPGCGPSEKDCGTCTPVTNPATGCAEPDVCDPCALEHTTQACGSTGACAVGRCDSGWGDCDRQATNGCEHSLDADIAACGACGRACAITGVAAAECQAGACTSSCLPGRANCAHPASGADDGCETSTALDSANCGGCNNSCSAQGLVCSDSRCGCSSRGQCGNGSGVDCVAGACTCDATTCRSGEKCQQSGGSRLCACNGGQACGPDEFCCQTPAGCVNVKTSVANCGACGHACTTNFACIDGACACQRDADCFGPGVSGGGGAAGSGDGGGAGDSSGGPACVSGVCACGTTACAPGQRCLADGSCG